MKNLLNTQPLYENLGEIKKFDSIEVSFERYFDYHFNILTEDYIYDMRQAINYQSEKDFIKLLTENTLVEGMCVSKL